MHKEIVWLKVSEMAKRSGLSKFVIRKLVDNGKIRGTRLNGQRVVMKEEFLDFLNALKDGRFDDFNKRKKTFNNWDDSETTFDPNEKGEPEPPGDDGEAEAQLEYYLERKRIKKLIEGTD